MPTRYVEPTRFPRIWATEPASWEWGGDGSAEWRWCRHPGIWFSTVAPTCDVCGVEIAWLGPPRRKLCAWVYEIVCGCGPDRLVSPYRLVVGGDGWFWRRFGARGFQDYGD